MVTNYLKEEGIRPPIFGCFLSFGFFSFFSLHLFCHLLSIDDDDQQIADVKQKKKTFFSTFVFSLFLFFASSYSFQFGLLLNKHVSSCTSHLTLFFLLPTVAPACVCVFNFVYFSLICFSSNLSLCVDYVVDIQIGKVVRAF